MNKKNIFIIFLFGFFLIACGEEETAAKKTEGMAELKEKAASVTPAPAQTNKMPGMMELENGVIYQEAIYKNWPYTETPVAATVEETVEQEESKTESTAGAVAIEPVTHTINAQARIFKPDTIYINPGDTVHWVNMTSHNTVSVEGLIPEGAKSWRGNIGENFQVKLDVVGIYPYVCEPHIGFGMVGVVVVGKPDNLEEVIQYAKDNLEGPYRRLIGKLIKVKIPE